jgi:hypothetical protein
MPKTDRINKIDRLKEKAFIILHLSCLPNPDNLVNTVYSLAFALSGVVTLSASLTTICGLKASKIGCARGLRDGRAKCEQNG